MRHLFGPIPSRRLGLSLGIDLTPGRQCSLNCAYCECGTPARLTIERAEFVPTDEVIAELRDALAPAPPLDAVTFSGMGEPTLHRGLGEILRFLRRDFPRYRTVVLTNGTLLGREDVRTDLAMAALVVPSLDAVSDDAFRRINHPHPSLRSADVLAGLEQFCRAHPGEIWLEVFLVPGVNDTPEELALLRDAVARLRVDRVQLNTLDRPGTMSWVRPLPVQNLAAIARLLHPRAEVIARPATRAAVAALPADTPARILRTVAARPCTLDDLAAMLGLDPLDTGAWLDVLLGDGALLTRAGERGLFYLPASPSSS